MASPPAQLCLRRALQAALFFTCGSALRALRAPTVRLRASGPLGGRQPSGGFGCRVAHLRRALIDHFYPGNGMSAFAPIPRRYTVHRLYGLLLRSQVDSRVALAFIRPLEACSASRRTPNLFSRVLALWASFACAQSAACIFLCRYLLLRAPFCSMDSYLVHLTRTSRLIKEFASSMAYSLRS